MHIATQLGGEPEQIAAAQHHTDAFFSRAYCLLHGLRAMVAVHRNATGELSSLSAAEGEEQQQEQEYPGSGAPRGYQPLRAGDSLVTPCDLANLAQHAAADARAFAREKYGVVPDVIVTELEQQRGGAAIVPVLALQPQVYISNSYVILSQSNARACIFDAIFHCHVRLILACV